MNRSEKLTKLALFFLPAAIIIAIILIFALRSPVKRFVYDMKLAFEQKNTTALHAALSDEFLEQHNLSRADVSKQIDAFYTYYDYPDVYLKVRDINETSDGSYDVRLVVKVLAVPKKSAAKGIYGDKRMIVFGSRLGGKKVRFVLRPQGDSFVVVDTDIPFRGRKD